MDTRVQVKTNGGSHMVEKEDAVKSTGVKRHGEKERSGARERDEAVKAELIQAGSHKVPKKAMIGAIAALIGCIAVIAVVVVVLNMLGITQSVDA